MDLARKYRPKRLVDYLGNTEMCEELMRLLRNEEYPQFYFFSGGSGCGKTTIARLLAKEYCCENRSSETGACGVCRSCQEFDKYIPEGQTNVLSSEVYEVDCSKVGKKEELNALFAQMQSPSFDGGWRICFLDECHAISLAGQQSLLKLLEDIPPKVLVILGTTDPDKVVEAIHTRCHHAFRVKKPKVRELCTQLKRACEGEGVKYEMKALSQICVYADLVPRVAMLALDRVIQNYQKVTVSVVEKLLGIVSNNTYLKFYDYLVTPINYRDISGYETFIYNTLEQVGDKEFLTGLIGFTKRSVYVYNGIDVDGLDIKEIQRVKKLFSMFNPADIVYLLDLLSKLNLDNLEITLMTLGYRGLLNVSSPAPDGIYIPAGVAEDSNAGVVPEKRLSVKAYDKEQHITEQEKAEATASTVAPVPSDALFGFFDGDVVTEML